MAEAPTLVDNLFTIEWKSKYFQPLLMTKLYGSTYFIAGKFHVEKKKKRLYLRRIELEYKGIHGLINFQIRKIEISRIYDKVLNTKVLNIVVFFRAFADAKTPFVYNVEGNRVVKKEDFIRVVPRNASKDIADLELGEDITSDEEQEITNDVPCRAKTDGGD